MTKEEINALGIAVTKHGAAFHLIGRGIHLVVADLESVIAKDLIPEFSVIHKRKKVLGVAPGIANYGTQRP